jgi:hypothetical protein
VNGIAEISHALRCALQNHRAYVGDSKIAIEQVDCIGSDDGRSAIFYGHTTDGHAVVVNGGDIDGTDRAMREVAADEVYKYLNATRAQRIKQKFLTIISGSVA